MKPRELSRAMARPTQSYLLPFLAPSIRPATYLVKRTLYVPPESTNAQPLDDVSSESNVRTPSPSQAPNSEAAQSRPPPPINDVFSKRIAAGLFNFRDHAAPRRNRPRYPAHTSDSTIESSLKIASSIMPASSGYKPPEPKLYLGPRAGKTVQVDPSRGVDVAAAIRFMETSVRRNGVKMTQRAQEFHVRRGQMRKNLKMVRWRRRFKASFQGAVGKIMKMKKQGW